MRVAVVSLLLFGTALRFAVNDVTTYSRADEQVMTNYAAALAQGATYRQMVAGYFASPEAHLYPPPLRWGYLLPASGLCWLVETCTPRVLAWLSTLAGIAAMALTWLLARELFGERVGVVALALAVPSTLQLAMGRRALQDEVVCAVFLGLCWAVVRLRA